MIREAFFSATILDQNRAYSTVYSSTTGELCSKEFVQTTDSTVVLYCTLYKHSYRYSYHSSTCHRVVHYGSSAEICTSTATSRSQTRDKPPPPCMNNLDTEPVRNIPIPCLLHCRQCGMDSSVSGLHIHSSRRNDRAIERYVCIHQH